MTNLTVKQEKFCPHLAVHGNEGSQVMNCSENTSATLDRLAELDAFLLDEGIGG